MEFAPAFTSAVSVDCELYFSGSPSAITSGDWPYPASLIFSPVGFPHRISMRYLPVVSPASGSIRYRPLLTAPPVPVPPSSGTNEMMPDGTGWPSYVKAPSAEAEGRGSGLAAHHTATAEKRLA